MISQVSSRVMEKLKRFKYDVILITIIIRLRGQTVRVEFSVFEKIEQHNSQIKKSNTVAKRSVRNCTSRFLFFFSRHVVPLFRQPRSGTLLIAFQKCFQGKFIRRIFRWSLIARARWLLECGDVGCETAIPEGKEIHFR